MVGGLDARELSSRRAGAQVGIFCFWRCSLWASTWKLTNVHVISEFVNSSYALPVPEGNEDVLGTSHSAYSNFIPSSFLRQDCVGTNTTFRESSFEATHFHVQVQKSYSARL